MAKFRFEDCITAEEKAVMYAAVTGRMIDGKMVSNLRNIEDGTDKGINDMLIKARKRQK
jgi:hypothetical protein